LLGVLSAPARFDPWWSNSAVDNFPLYYKKGCKKHWSGFEAKKQSDFNNPVEKKNES
jgi:hypothetical protein